MFGNKDLTRRVKLLETHADSSDEIVALLRNDLDNLKNTFKLLTQYVDEKLERIQQQADVAISQLTEIDATHPPLIQELSDKVNELRMDVNSYRMELSLAPVAFKTVPAEPPVPLVSPSVLSEIRPEPHSSKVELVKDDILAWLRASYAVKHKPVEVDFDTEVAAEAFRLSERRFREYLNMLHREGIVEPIGVGRSRFSTYGRIRIHPARTTR